MLHPWSKATGSSSTSLALSKARSHKTCSSRRSPLFKLWMSVAGGSRRKFNFTVSVEILVYRTVVRTGKSLNGYLRSGGGLLEFI
jgi:hypothetical protein